jgi:hypothetical protein
MTGAQSDSPYYPGTFGEVTHAYDMGKLTSDEYKASEISRNDLPVSSQQERSHLAIQDMKWFSLWAETGPVLKNSSRTIGRTHRNRCTRAWRGAPNRSSRADSSYHP